MLGRWVGDKLILLNSLKNVYISFLLLQNQGHNCMTGSIVLGLLCVCVREREREREREAAHMHLKEVI
jgi:hypothetical protein